MEPCFTNNTQALSSAITSKHMFPAAARYREYVPCKVLQDYVRSFFTFTAPIHQDQTGRPPRREVLFRAGEPFSAPLFADGHLSIIFSFGSAYRIDGLWAPRCSGPAGHVIGAMSKARAACHGNRIVQIGAYLRAAQTRPFISMPACEFTDQVVALSDLWHTAASDLEAQLNQATNDGERILLFEAALLGRLAQDRSKKGRLDLPSVAGWMLQQKGTISIDRLASAAGVSRQHLTRVFREEVGVSPKLYSRLARFRAALHLAGCASLSRGAEIAAEIGYADQSHMIAEFRQFSGLTPGSFTHHQHFHPFICVPG
jgi:AraC-like DNA-binding protein